MKKSASHAAAFLLSVFAALPAPAATNAQLAAIDALGRLNGIALQCSYLQQARRIKTGLIEALPKQRQLGLLFEEATNESFLASLKDAAGCPAEEELSRRIDTGFDVLERAFEE